jgi:transcriptional regulator with XRE-family HTH domain
MLDCPAMTTPLTAANAARTIRDAREALGWTQAQLAVKAHVNVETVLRAEKARPVKFATLEKIYEQLPGIGAERLTRAETPGKETAALQNLYAVIEQLGHLLYGVNTLDGLHTIRSVILQVLSAEHEQVTSAAAAGLAAFSETQRRAEQRLAKRGKHKATTNGRDQQQ